MWIDRFYSENFLGFDEGMGRAEVDVDFSPALAAGVGRMMVFGRNGSGKSTLIKALSPFPSNGDDRALIVPGRSGRKVVELVRPGDGARIACDIRWTKAGKTSCFLSVNGEVLPSTAKGNVGTYMDAVRAELGVTPAYLKIGRVGSNIDGFLDMLATERKSYIGQFMPEMAEWAEMHKNASRRMQDLQRELQGMRVELGRIEPREELEAAANRAQADHSRLAEEVRSLDERVGAARGALNEMSPSRDRILRDQALEPASCAEFNPLYALAEEQEALAAGAQAQLDSLAQARATLAPYITDRPACARKIAELTSEVARLEGETRAAAEARSGTRARVDRAIREEQAAGADLRRIESSGGQLQQLRAQEGEQVSAFEAAKTRSFSLPEVPEGLVYEQVKGATDALAQLETEMAVVRSAFPSVDALDMAAKALFDDATLSGMAAANDKRLRDMRARIESAQGQVNSIESQAIFHRRFAHMKCSDPKCPFEAHLKTFGNVAKELEDKKTEIRSAQERIESAEAAASDAGATRAAARAALQLHSRIALLSHQATFTAAGVWSKFVPIEAFAQLVASTGTATADALNVRKILDAVAAKRDFAEATRVLEATRSRIADIEALVAARETVRAAKERAAQSLLVLRAEHEAAEAEHSRLLKASSGRATALQLLERIEALHVKRERAEGDGASYRSAADELDQISGRWAGAEAEEADCLLALAECQRGLQAASRALQDAQLKRGRRDDFEARLAEKQGQLHSLQTVCDACHPARGAPVEFLRDFLDVTRDTANDLLDLALGGEFRIGFELSDTEFRIPVSKGSGRTIPDVKEASDGQLSLAKTIISLALIKQTILGAGAYNVVALDEIDGPLDKEKNRRRFTEIVDRLMADLGVEQHFVISHNDNFHSSPAGLVLFPGHSMDLEDGSFMANKILLADFS